MQTAPEVPQSCPSDYFFGKNIQNCINKTSFHIKGKWNEALFM